ncbi:glutathionylspermidine synthase family protein, partial [Lactiplantibacillus plantarum]|nr:glutathionylspermidine synthase family protein [Lactiplantibacillus plantarum]
VELIDRGLSGAEVVDGGYGEGRWIRQALHDPPLFDGNHAIVGSWVVGAEPAGISLREDKGRITRNTSRFVAHFIRD